MIKIYMIFIELLLILCIYEIYSETISINDKNLDININPKFLNKLYEIEDKCTTIAVGKKAGIEGPMASHTADCSNCDFRINKVSARDYDVNNSTSASFAKLMRPIYLYRNGYPSTVSSLRGKTWDPNNLEGNPEQIAAWGPESPIITYIEQVNFFFFF